MIMITIRQALVLLLLLPVAGIPFASGDELTQTFASWTPGDSSSEGWSVGNGAVVVNELSYTNTTPNSLKFQSGIAIDGYLDFPVITNGLGRLIFSHRLSSITPTNILFQKQVSGGSWTTLAAIQVLDSWTRSDIPINEYGTNYFRLYLPGTLPTRKGLYLDDICVSNPPARVEIGSAIARTPLESSTIHVNDPVNITAFYTPYGMPSNPIAMTASYRVGESGSWISIGMTNNNNLSFTTATPIPGQGLVTVYYYVTATFDGPPPDAPLSPTNFPADGRDEPLSYTVIARPYNSQYDSVSVTNQLTSTLTLINDNMWESFIAYTGASFNIGFSLSNNTTTTSWGDTDPVTNIPPFTQQADLNSFPIHIIPTTNTGQFVVRFAETNRAYTFKQAEAHNFDSWSFPNIGNDTNAQWTLHQGCLSAQDGIKLRNTFAVLESNTTAWIASPKLPDGIGEISFWYRNFNTNGTPITAAYVEKSKTGGTNDADWVRIATVNDIYANGWNRFTVVPADRTYSFVRVRNSTNVPNARLCLDELMVAMPGAGVLFTNVSHTPASPAASNSVTVSATITPAGNASDVTATLWYRAGSTGTWASTGMTPSDNLFTTSIPAGSGDKSGGAGLVQYYIECTFSGFESNLSSPFVYPEFGSNSPLTYVVKSATLVATNATSEPAPPLTGAETRLCVDMIPQDGASNIAVTASYRLNRTGDYTNLPMAWVTNNTYRTTAAIPAQSLYGQALEYFFTATFDGPDAVSPTNYPANASATVFNTVFHAPAWTSTYSGVCVTGDVERPMYLSGDNNWRAVVTNMATTNSRFRFAGTGPGSPVWREENQSVTNLPVYGTAETNGSLSDILMAGPISGTLLFQLNETGQYSVQKAAYASAFSWPSNTYGWYAHDGWLLGGRGSDESDYDQDRVFSGPFVILRGAGLSGAGTNNFLRSPEMTNGIGEISFFYRNYASDGSQPVKFVVEVAPTATAETWQAVATVTNILSADYRFFYTFLSDRVNKYVRIRNDSPNEEEKRLCLDEVVVTDGGASVTFSNLTLAPTNPTIMDPVTVSVTLTPQTGASDFTPVLWYRAGTNEGAYYESLVMTNVSDDLYRTTIPNGYVGNMYFFIQCGFSGFGSAYSSPAYYPYGGSANAIVYTNVDGGVFEGFETWPYAISERDFIGAEFNDWMVFNSYCAGGGNYFAAPTSTNKAIWFVKGAIPRRPDNNLKDSFLITPVITNLYGMVHLTFSLRNLSANLFNTIGLYTTYDYSPSTNFSDSNVWNFVGSFTPTSNTAWTEYQVDFTNNDFRILLCKLSGESFIGIDRVEIAQRSSLVTFSNLLVHPGYPASNDLVWISCEIDSVKPGMPAFNLNPSLRYKLPGGVFQPPIAMTRLEGTRSFTTASGIPASAWDKDVSYYIECAFDGYSHTPALNQSPMPFPTNNPTTEPLLYRPRLKMSDYGTFEVGPVAGVAQMDLLDDYVWQGVLNLATPVDGMAFRYYGSSNYTGQGFSGSVSNWGRPVDHWKTNLPQVATAVANTAEFISIAGSLSDQYLFRLDEQTGDYSAQQCVAQDLENWGATPNYIFSGSSESDQLLMTFDNWPSNTVRTQFDNFDLAATWTNKNGSKGFNYYTNMWYAGNASWGIYDAALVRTNLSGSSLTYAVALNPTNTIKGKVINSQVIYNPLKGVGVISFKYRSGHTNAYDAVEDKWIPADPIPVTLKIWTSPTNGIDSESKAGWELVDTITNITDKTKWTSHVCNVNTGAYRCVIIEHAEGAEKVLLDDLSFSDFNARYYETNGWKASEVWIQSKSGYTSSLYGIEFDSRRFTAEPYLKTPVIQGGVGFFNFWYKNASNDGSSVSFDVYFCRTDEGGGDLGQIKIGSGSNTSATYTQFAASPMTNQTGYMKIVPTSTNRLVIDDVLVTGRPGTNTWEANNAQIANETDRRFRGTALYLNNSLSGSGDIKENEWPYIKTPYLPHGIGEVSFWYRNWEQFTAPTPATIHLQKSEKGADGNTNWVTFASLTNIVNKSYHYYRTYLYDTQNRYVRIINDTNNATARVAIDEFVVTAPLAADITLSNLRIDPEAPIYSNDVHVLVDLKDPFLDPAGIELFAQFSVATNHGGWTDTNSLAMEIVSATPSNRTWTYRTIEPIPKQPSDRFVLYQIKATFSGLNAANNTSPKYERSFSTPSFYYPLDYGTSTPYYIVLSCPTNAVWINEIDPGVGYSYGEHYWDFVEIAGRHYTDISGWNVVFLNADAEVDFTYPIPANTFLASQTNGFGFYVLGKDSLTLGNLYYPELFPPVFVNQKLDDADNMSYPGGVALQRPAGMYCGAVAFGTDISQVSALTQRRFTWIDADGADYYDDWPCSISMVGTGSFVSAFSPKFSADPATPGWINEGQTLIPQTGLDENKPPTSVSIVGFELFEDRLWFTVTGTNGWYPGLWLTTNLSLPSSWTNVSDTSQFHLYKEIQPDGTYLMYYNVPTGAPAYFFKVVTTNASQY